MIKKKQKKQKKNTSIERMTKPLLQLISNETPIDLLIALYRQVENI